MRPIRLALGLSTHMALLRKSYGDTAASVSRLTAAADFGRLIGIHVAVVGQARFNGYFSCNTKNPNNDRTFYQLSPDMHDSLLKLALSIAPGIRKAEKVALNRRREAKQRRIKLLREKKIVAARREYANALTYIDIFHSSDCW